MASTSWSTWPSSRTEAARRSGATRPRGVARSVGGLGALLRPERVDLALEVLEVLEALVHAGEPDVGDLVQLLSLAIASWPTLLRTAPRSCPRTASWASIWSAAASADAVRHGPARERLAQAVGELVAIELLARAVTLDDQQARRLDSLVGRESGAARRALAPAANGRGVVEVARIDHPGVSLTTDWTSHRYSILLAPLWVVVFAGSYHYM